MAGKAPAATMSAPRARLFAVVLSLLLLLPALVYFVWIAARREPVRVRQWEFDLPSPALFVGQVAISVLDWMIAAGVLYILLPDSLPLTFFPDAKTY